MNSRNPKCEPFIPAGARRPVIWIFAPGLKAAASSAARRYPALERLIARGARREMPAGPWAALARILGGDLVRWPVGPVSCLGDGRRPRDGCLRVSPTGGDPESQGLARVPAGALELSMEEARMLAARFGATLGDGCLSIHPVTPTRWYLDGTPDWAGAEGPDAGGLPSGAPALMRLISEIEMLFFDDPVNRSRAASGLPRVAGIQAWGGGILPEAGPAAVPAGWGAEPYARGLWDLAGVEPGPVETVVEAGGVAWPSAAEDAGPALPDRIEEGVAAAALNALARGRLGEVRLFADDTVFVTRTLGARLPWRRPRPLPEAL